jgi:hypothetical protein
MLVLITILIMAGVGYAFLVEGIFTAFLMFCNLIGAGILAFNFWEPLADQLDPAFQETFLAGYEDTFCLVSLFCVSLIVLRTLTNLTANTFVEFPEAVQRGGGAVFGLLTGYLATGFLLTVMQTLPMDQHFMSFDFHYDPNQSAARAVLPPDRAWLALMSWAGGHGLSASEDSTFDKGGSFELRYARYRRYDDTPKHKFPVPYFGEFDEQLGRR